MTDLYQMQRAMRNMRRAAMQRGVVAILDVGSSKIACLVLRFDGDEPAREDGLGPDRKSTRLNSSHIQKSRMPSSA